MPALYPGHLPTSAAQKVFVAGAAAVKALADPRRADMVATLAEVTGRVALERLQRRLRASDEGRHLLAERPLISTATMATLGSDCAPSSFGGRYASFMQRHRLDADERSPVALVDDAELAYILLRYRQVHDFWHVLCGLPPTLFGEVSLKWFELAQTGLPMTALAALAGPARLSAAQRARLASVYVPWALREGARAKDLLAVKYEDHLHTHIDDLRASLSLRPAPLAQSS